MREAFHCWPFVLLQIALFQMTFANPNGCRQQSTLILTLVICRNLVWCGLYENIIHFARRRSSGSRQIASLPDGLLDVSGVVYPSLRIMVYLQSVHPAGRAASSAGVSDSEL